MYLKTIISVLLSNYVCMYLSSGEKIMKYKKISIVTPTLNSMRTLEMYLDAVDKQVYPHKYIELIFVDGGSTDGTLEKITQYRKESDFKISVFENPLRTGEAGKSVGVKKARGEIICLLDSDNIIPDTRCMERMIKPFQDEKIVASEPIAYTYRKKDNVINRYCALIGMGDPLCMFTGNYDRYCRITNKWTEVDREEMDCGDYLSVCFHVNMIPTIGANGFFIRRKFLIKKLGGGEYLFDIDILWEILLENPQLRIAKVKTGIIHLYCDNFQSFYRKQIRRISDYYYFNYIKQRKYPWNKVKKGKIVMFCLSCITVIPLLLQAIIGFRRKQDLRAWLFHIAACWITLWAYGWGTIKSVFRKKIVDRNHWKQ